MRKIISRILKFFAKKAIKKNSPIVIGITGSMGKTSARNAASFVLEKHFSIGGGIKNYNNEIGYPLSILGLESASKNIFAWMTILLKAFKKVYFSLDFPDILVLELGAGKPGDIDYLGSIAPLDIAIITSVGTSHLEKFGTIKQVAKEKANILKYIKKTGKLVYNFDDELVRDIAKNANVETISFGFNKGADVQVVSGNEINLNFDDEGNFDESFFKIERSGSFMPVRLAHIISKAQVYSVLSAIAISDILELNLVETVERMKDFKCIPGRMNLIEGINS